MVVFVLVDTPQYILIYVDRSMQEVKSSQVEEEYAQEKNRGVVVGLRLSSIAAAAVAAVNTAVQQRVKPY